VTDLAHFKCGAQHRVAEHGCRAVLFGVVSIVGSASVVSVRLAENSGEGMCRREFDGSARLARHTNPKVLLSCLIIILEVECHALDTSHCRCMCTMVVGGTQQCSNPLPRTWVDEYGPRGMVYTTYGLIVDHVLTCLSAISCKHVILYMLKGPSRRGSPSEALSVTMETPK